MLCLPAGQVTTCCSQSTTKFAFDGIPGSVVKVTPSSTEAWADVALPLDEALGRLERLDARVATAHDSAAPSPPPTTPTPRRLPAI